MGSFDVSMVCPLPGSWINHVLYVLYICGFSEYEVTFARIFIGFAESRPWECRVVSFKIARASQKSRVFPGKGLGPGFSLSGRPSALDRTLFERSRRIFCMHFYRVS